MAFIFPYSSLCLCGNPFTQFLLFLEDRSFFYLITSVF
jgi:hypothetical protein